ELYHRRNSVNVMVFDQHSRNSHAIISFDVEKAFDRVNWQYLFLTQDKFGLGKSFINTRDPLLMPRNLAPENPRSTEIQFLLVRDFISLPPLL
uniref:Reverse transcriptase domain-containing protein n=1 Tax=Gopherus agassizii TaxID=38772 RepID=A0A452HXV7_9SAUR